MEARTYECSRVCYESARETYESPRKGMECFFKGVESSLKGIKSRIRTNLWTKLANLNGHDWALYAGRVDPFAGQTVNLRFTSGVDNWPILDAVTFSPSLVPEPSCIGMLIAAGSVIVLKRLR